MTDGAPPPVESRHAPGTLGHAVDRGAAHLRSVGIETARLDARVLAAHVLGREVSFILTHPETGLSEDDHAAVEALIARRAMHEPVSRILGEKEFWSMTFKVTEATLTPRPDTETLVEQVLGHLRESGRENDELRLLDLGTGTGCLLLALLSELPVATGLGVDINADAAAVAEENARRLGLGTRADFRVGDWAAGLDGPFDVIVSNPPYIADGMRAELAPEVRDFDPPGALFAGAEGLDAYRIIAPQAAKLLAPGGLIGFEIGQGQDAAVAEILRVNGFERIELRADLAGIPRALSGRAPSP